MRYALCLAALFALCAEAGETTILNASYDVSREFYQDYDALFVEHWRAAHGETVTVHQSHGGSSTQARAVLDGLEADVVTMNQATDVDMLASKGLVATDWRERLPDRASPYTSTIVLLVRKGNPKAIRDWDDLVRDGVAVIVPNPKTSGNGRYSYLAAWDHGLAGGDAAKAEAFVKALFAHVPVLDTGGRAATTTFVERGIGDVLLTFENEVHLIAKDFARADFEVVYPRRSVLAEAPVAVVAPVVDKRGTRALAEDYLAWLWSEPAQALVVKHHFRPRRASVPTQDSPAITLFTVEEVFGSWVEAQRVHFADGGTFDRIYQPGSH